MAHSLSSSNCACDPGFPLVNDGGHNLDDGSTCGFSTANGSLNNTDPLLGPAGLANNGGPTQTIALLAGNPAIDAGDISKCPPTDQRGVLRRFPGDLICDIGAYEASAPFPSPLDVDLNGAIEVSTDLVYISCYLLGLPPVPASFRTFNPSIPPDSTISANIAALGASLDVDGNGIVDVATDIVYIARHLLGLAPVPPSFRVVDPTIPSDADITAQINALL